jgi:hypothetical protein
MMDNRSGLRATSGEAKLDFANLRAITQLQSGRDRLLQRRRDLFFDDRFSQTGGFQSLTNIIVSSRPFPQQQRDDGLAEHGAQFARRSGQQDDPACATVRPEEIGPHFDRQAGGGAVVVAQDARADGRHRLHFHRGWHPAVALGKVPFDPGQSFRIQLQLAAEKVGDQTAGDVIGSRA